MLFSGVTSVFPVPSNEDVEITEQQQEKFVKCVLTNTPYTEAVKFGDISVVFTTPNAREYEVLANVENDKFADYLFASNIKSIRKGEEILYVKNAEQGMEEILTRLTKLFQDSIVFPLLVGYWYQFRSRYNKLYKEALSPSFFVKERTTSGG